MRQYDDIEAITTIRRHLLLSHTQFKGPEFDMKKALAPAKTTAKKLRIARSRYLKSLDKQEEGELNNAAILACRQAALPFLIAAIPYAEDVAALEKEAGEQLSAMPNTVQIKVHRALLRLVEAWQT